MRHHLRLPCVWVGECAFPFLFLRIGAPFHYCYIVCRLEQDSVMYLGYKKVTAFRYRLQKKMPTLQVFVKIGINRITNSISPKLYHESKCYFPVS